MICLRCGHCCIEYEVIIIKDINKNLSTNNLEPKHSGIKCKYLNGDKPGEYRCSIHDHPKFKKTPCFQFSQIEASRDSLCRIGSYLTKS
jgi:hypothetical protein